MARLEERRVVTWGDTQERRVVTWGYTLEAEGESGNMVTVLQAVDDWYNMIIVLSVGSELW